MSSCIGLVALVVADYDEAIDWFTGKLGFSLTEDSDRGAGKRWVVVTPPGGGTSLLLARAVNDDQRRAIGNQTGGRVFLFLETEDFHASHAKMKTQGVHFTENPRHEEYGFVAVFEDLYGNRWDLLGPAT